MMNKGKIFIVDDSFTALHSLHAYLQSVGFDVSAITSGECLFQELATHRPDLILLDILMPGLSGFDICSRLKEDQETRQIPVIFMTALSDSIDKIRGFEAGGVDYVTKPLDYQEVAMRINTHLKIRRLQEQLETQNLQLEAQNIELECEIAERIQTALWLQETLARIELAKQEWEVTADSLSHIICLLDAQGRILRINRSIEAWHLGQVVSMKGKTVHDVLHKNCEDPTCYLQQFAGKAQEFVAQHQSAECEITDSTLNRSLNIQVRPILSQDVRKEELFSASYSVCIIQDVTNRKQAEQTLQERTKELVLLNKLNSAMQRCQTMQETFPLIVNTCQELIPCSSGTLSIMDDEGNEFQEVAFWGQPSDTIRRFGPDDFWVFDHDHTKAIPHPAAEALSTYIGYSSDQQSLCLPIRDANDILAILSIDIAACSERSSDAVRFALAGMVEQYALSLVNIKLRERLRQESILDPLTNLYNRRHMEISLSREVRRAQRHNTPVGVMMLDVDHFKLLNDTYSHEAGDIVLKELGSLILRHIRAEDIACRYGGEEFLLILPEASLSDIRQRAEELRIIIKQMHIRYREHLLNFTISIGIAGLPEHGFRESDILHAADLALYQAKSQGRDRVVLAPY